ncbi:sulfhydryl oxidase 2-like [Mya arenaria]|uniref:sulfhydryl oxidase 2-like n=1 Tax=Mya arenaria TaxID=6604 RepID=UPI0022DED1C9|nr:sulfhydryl oxidase 2-like [Mya arenaria]
MSMMKCLTYCVLNIVLIVQIAHKLALSETLKGLYDNNDKVYVLNHRNFDKNVVGSESVWLVEFYNSWCGHCINFAPKWKEFAAEKTAWWPIVQIAAVDCAVEENTELCRVQNIRGFPSFKLFPPRYKPNGTVVQFHAQEKPEIEDHVINFISNTTLVEPPKSWPNLAPIKSMEDIWDEAKDEHRHVAFVCEDEGSHIGRQIILDTYRYKPLLVRRMLRGAVKKFGVDDLPALFLINRDGTFTNLAKKDNSREGMLHDLLELLSADELGAGDKYIAQREEGRKADGVIEMEQAQLAKMATIPEKKPAVYMSDLESTLHYAFRQEVAICSQIKGEQLTALKTFINVLIKYFPGRECLQTYLEKVAAWLATVTTEISGEQWLNKIDELQTVSDYLRDRVRWVGCSGSEARYRGYPCGLWTLFHTLTVGMFTHTRQYPKDLPIDVLSAIAGYMKHFFGCETCVKHFLGMTKTITVGDRKPSGSILWLWQAHNKANARLRGDITEDPKYPKLQFPPKTLCPECQSDTGVFIKSHVFDFFVKFYGKSAIILESDDSFQTGSEINPAVTPERDLDWWELHQRRKDLEKIRSLRKIKKEKSKSKQDDRINALVAVNSKAFHQEVGQEVEFTVQQQRYSWGFTNLDMGMCVLFYVLCSLVILILYYHFIVRRKYRPCHFFMKKVIV